MALGLKKNTYGIRKRVKIITRRGLPLPRTSNACKTECEAYKTCTPHVNLQWADLPTKLPARPLLFLCTDWPRIRVFKFGACHYFHFFHLFNLKFLPLFKKKAPLGHTCRYAINSVLDSAVFMLTKETNGKSRRRWNNTMLPFVYHGSLLLLIIEKKKKNMQRGRCWNVSYRIARFCDLVDSKDSTRTVSVKTCPHSVWAAN